MAIELPHSGAVRGSFTNDVTYVQHHVLGLGQGHRGGPDGVGEAGLVMHLADDLQHAAEQWLVGVDDHVDPVAEHVQLVGR